jgi:hypothetical protein
MPIMFTVDHARGEVHTVASGPVSYEDVEQHVQKQRDAGLLRYREFFDGRDGEVTFTAIDAHRVVELMRKLVKEGAVGPRAVLAKAGHTFGLSRMIEMQAEEFCELKIFRDEDEARTWLAAK